MAEVFVVGSNGERYANEHGGHYLPHKEIFTDTSPRSPLSGAHSPDSAKSIGLAPDRVVNHSIEELYNNVYDMPTSDHSLSRYSMLSYGQESRIDSELRYLAGEDFEEVEETKEVITINNQPVEHTSPNAEGVMKTSEKVGKKKISSPTNDKSLHITSVKSKPKVSSSSKSSHDKPPTGKQSLKNLKQPKSPLGVVKKFNVSSEGGYLGPYLLKRTRDLVASGKDSEKVLELALRAKEAFESCANEKPNLEYVMCLHVVAALHCSLGQYNEAIPLLECSIEIPVVDEGLNHALARFSGCMQLGDTYAMLGEIENSIHHYTAGLEIQRNVLGENDPRFGETCRYVAEAYVQNLQFEEAEKYCQKALSIHKENGSPASLEEAADRRLMGLICESKGDYEAALEHYVLASMSMAENGQEEDVASINCNIGDTYLYLARYDDAVFTYQKALTVFKSIRGENHSSVASVFVRLANLYNKTGKFRESKSYCENALRFYQKIVPGSSVEEISSGLVEVSAIYESMNDLDQSLSLLHKAVKLYEGKLCQQSMVAGIEARMGVLKFMMKNYSDSYNCLKGAISKFRSIGEKKSVLFGITLNQMGLACLQLNALDEAANMFEEARSVLEAEYGPYHADTLGVYRNLAGTYYAMNRCSDAIEVLELLIKIRGENSITATSDLEDEKMMLCELLKEISIAGIGKSKSVETLFDANSILVPEGESDLY